MGDLYLIPYRSDEREANKHFVLFPQGPIPSPVLTSMMPGGSRPQMGPEDKKLERVLWLLAGISVALGLIALFIR